MGRDFLITGSPRSGTRFMAALFRSAGLGATHEGVFIPAGIRPRVIKNVESSWLAAPHLQTWKYHFKKVIHLVRDPILVISSQREREIMFKKESPYTKYIYDNVSEITNFNNSIDNYLHFWIAWNEMIEKHTKIRVKIEDINNDREKFLQDLGVYTIGRQLYKNFKCNSDGETKKITMEEIEKSQWSKKFKEKAKQYGYDL